MAAEPLKLDETDDPFAIFAQWLDAATQTEPNDPNAMTLATVDAQGLPNARVVLLKGFDQRGFVFYTNFESAKGQELQAARKAALCFHWKSLRRQVRVRGAVGIVSPEEADLYYASRPRGSRIGAWASRQSHPLDSRGTLEARVAEVEARFGSGDIARPPHWSGFRVEPVEMEFWQDGASRLHDRFRFTRESAGDAWAVTRLYP
ncbi:pyridoxamine 5'-phosphate oxidase [Aureimonas populi]|uniref:Pyridoxine/pyridoxamine 5'-phosphate oxidase n=1 Tax=Aureimonas populi TaxID=1701758 RepID=A0ABW5CIX9_9HYPH|nr:pyridoxamine 5'-phosphate oxidase [Aureimonas populi]